MALAAVIHSTGRIPAAYSAALSDRNSYMDRACAEDFPAFRGRDLAALPGFPVSLEIKKVFV